MEHATRVDDTVGMVQVTDTIKTLFCLNGVSGSATNSTVLFWLGLRTLDNTRF